MQYILLMLFIYVNVQLSIANFSQQLRNFEGPWALNKFFHAKLNNSFRYSAYSYMMKLVISYDDHVCLYFTLSQPP